jgi:hypothetical protein
MLGQLNRLLRLRVLRVQRAKIRYENLVVKVGICRDEKTRCLDKRLQTSRQLMDLLVEFEAALDSGEVSGEQMAALEKERAYLDKLDLFYEAELLEAEYQYLEASEQCENARASYLHALREQERIEKMVAKVLKEAQAELAAADEDQAAESWTPR